MSRSFEEVRLLTIEDIHQIRRLLQTSEYVYQRFTLEELPTTLLHYPALGVFNNSSLRSFILTQTVRAPSAWIAGFCVRWTESRAYARLLETLLAHLAPHLVARSVHYLHYSGNDVEHDWLRDNLLTRGFLPYRLLFSYDKLDFTIPTQGNQQIIIRPVTANDIQSLLPIEEACFEELWRYDSLAFHDIPSTHPSFLLPQFHGNVAGYQLNAL